MPRSGNTTDLGPLTKPGMFLYSLEVANNYMVRAAAAHHTQSRSGVRRPLVISLSRQSTCCARLQVTFGGGSPIIRGGGEALSLPCFL